MRLDGHRDGVDCTLEGERLFYRRTARVGEIITSKIGHSEPKGLMEVGGTEIASRKYCTNQGVRPNISLLHPVQVRGLINPT